MVRFSTVVRGTKATFDGVVAGAAGSSVGAAGRIKKLYQSARSETVSEEGQERKKQSIEDLILENEVLRKRIGELEARLEQQRQDFEAQQDLRSFGGLSMLRATNVTIGKQLGQGAFGAVFRGKWRGVTCALKFIKQSVADELRNECSIMDKIDHPNIVRLYGVVVDDGDPPESWPEGLRPPCLVMECMGYEVVESKKKCGTFIEYLEATKSTTRRDNKVEYWIQLCGMLQGAARGLAYLHSHGVMHRDLKGVNLLVDSRCNLKIADFGLATLYVNGIIERLAISGSFISGPLNTPAAQSGLTTAAGTYTHMAPEVMTSGDYDTTADIFSFGIVLSEAIAAAEGEEIVDATRTPKFGLDTDKLLQIAGIGGDDDGDSSAGVCGIVKQLVDLAGKCCDLDPEERPNADQVVGRLQLILISHQSKMIGITTPADEDKIKVTEVEASLQIFNMIDQDGDGFLSFDECLSLANSTDEVGLTVDDYDYFCEHLGADKSRGLSQDDVVKMYTELGIGDPIQDWDRIRNLDSPR